MDKIYWLFFKFLIIQLIFSGVYANEGREQLDQKSFVIVVPSYNNKEWYQDNLDSIFEQNYENYRVIYIDDASSDGTGDLVERYIKQRGMEHKVSLIKNKENQGVLANTVNAVYHCLPHEIVVIVDGDDWLSDSHVLEYLNSVYHDPDVWMTYGQYIEFPSGEKAQWVHRVPYGIIENNAFRSYDWVTSHLRTFYAALFQKIVVDDFKKDGRFLKTAADLAAMFPMLEMAGEHSRYISRIMYVYNTASSINNFKIRHSLQLELDYWVRSKEKYKPLEDVFFANDFDSDCTQYVADLIVFSYDRPLQLYAFLESVDLYASNVGRIFIIYKASSNEYESTYKKCFDAFLNLPLVLKRQDINKQQNDFKQLTMEALNEANDYVVFAVDDIMITDNIDFSEVVKYLKYSDVYGFYLRLGENITECYMRNITSGVPKYTMIDGKVFKWKIADGVGDWGYPNTLDMTVYPKNKILSAISDLYFTSPNTFEGVWDKAGKHNGSYNESGICYRSSKIINIPFNLVQQDYKANRHMMYSKQDFLNLFNSGQRIDVKRYFHVAVKAPHAELPLHVRM